MISPSKWHIKPSEAANLEIAPGGDQKNGPDDRAIFKIRPF
jgi:hypothetical protein